MGTCFTGLAGSTTTLTATRANGGTLSVSYNTVEYGTSRGFLHIMQATGTVQNNTDTYLAWGVAFPTACIAAVPVSTAGFNALNALSTISYNKNGVTVKQRNESGAAMNVIVLGFGY